MDIGYWIDAILPWVIVLILAIFIILALIEFISGNYAFGICLIVLVAGLVVMGNENWMLVNFGMAEAHSLLISVIIIFLGLVGAIQTAP